MQLYRKNPSITSEPTETTLVIEHTDTRIIERPTCYIDIEHVKTIKGNGFRAVIHGFHYYFSGEVQLGMGRKAYYRAICSAHDLIEKRESHLRNLNYAKNHFS